MLYKLITYGCQMNAHESERLEGILVSLGYKKTEDAAAADLILFNTCCIRQGAEDRVFSNIGALLKYKKNKPGMIIGVCGCMPQKQDSLEKLKERFPYVDLIFGTHNLHELKALLEKRRESGDRVIEVWEKEQEIREGGEYLRGKGDTAWVNITFGCDNYCSYCVVPYVRGRERSRRAEDILKEIKEIAAAGKYAEICLLGQNVNSYRGTYGNIQINFARLLEIICMVPGDFRITFMTSHPKDLSDEVIALIARKSKIKKSLHLPVQSGSDAMLNAMNRKYTADSYLTLVDRIKAAIPEIVLTSDIIVGFPGETEDDYDKTLELIGRVRFHNLYMFMFSARQGTPAHDLPDQIPLETKRKRLMKLIAIQRNIQKEL